MHSQLEEYQSDFRTIKTEATRLVEELDEETLRTPPDDDTWSVAQVFDHLNTTVWPLLNELENAIQTGQDNGPYGTPPFEYGVVSRWFIRSMKPSSWALPAPSVLQPEESNTLYPHETIEEFRGLQDQFANCVESAEGLDLRRIRVGSPVFPLLRISIGAWFEATIAHERRHLAQIRNLLPLVLGQSHRAF